MADKKVTFACQCPQSIGEARIKDAATKEVVKLLRWTESGEKAVMLAEAKYEVRIRATGTPGTPFSLAVTKGGTMNPFADTLPKEGGTAATRVLTVPEKDK